LINILLKHGVKIHQAEDSFQVKNVTSYQRKNITNKTFTKGTFIVSTDQARHLLSIVFYPQIWQSKIL